MKQLQDFFDRTIPAITYHSLSIEDTISFASLMAQYLSKTDCISLEGELGSGKTVFMQGIARFFHVESILSSPTFTIVNEYNSDRQVTIYHFDVYRIKSQEEFLETVGCDYFDQGICIIEWGNLIPSVLPNHTIVVQIDKQDTNTRTITVRRKL